MNTTISNETSDIGGLPLLPVPNLEWKSLVKLVPTSKQMEALRLPSTHGMVHYRDGVVTVATGHFALRIAPTQAIESAAGGFLIDPKAALVAKGVVAPVQSSSTAGYAALDPYFVELDAHPHHVRLMVDANHLKRFCEIAIAITRMGYMTITMMNPATHPTGDREDIVNPVMITFDESREEQYRTRGLLAAVQARGREFKESPRQGLPLLSNATKQQLQMELLRRVVQPHIGLDGSAIARTLETHPHLWHHIEVPQTCWLNLLSLNPRFQSFTLKIAHHRLAADEAKMLDLMQSWSYKLYCDLDDREYTCVQWEQNHND